MSLTIIVHTPADLGPEGETKFHGSALFVIAEHYGSNGISWHLARMVIKHRDSDDSSDIAEINLSAKNETEPVDHGDDTNCIRTGRPPSQYKTGRGIVYAGGKVSTRHNMVDGLWLAILATTSKGSLYQRGRNSQSCRSEQKAAEKGELGHHGGDDGAVNRGCNESLRQRESISQPLYVRHVLIKGN